MPHKDIRDQRAYCAAHSAERAVRARLWDQANPERIAWRNARKRTTDPSHPKWPNWGGRGIRMAQEWLDSFDAFLAHIGPRPGPGYSLDRIDNDGNYEPGNVRWATASEQGRNQRSGWATGQRKAA